MNREDCLYTILKEIDVKCGNDSPKEKSAKEILTCEYVNAAYDFLKARPIGQCRENEVNKELEKYLKHYEPKSVVAGIGTFLILTFISWLIKRILDHIVDNWNK